MPVIDQDPRTFSSYERGTNIRLQGHLGSNTGLIEMDFYRGLPSAFRVRSGQSV